MSMSPTGRSFSCRQLQRPQALSRNIFQKERLMMIMRSFCFCGCFNVRSIYLCNVKHVDYIIAGQGIAGSLLAWFLLQRGKQVLVVDPQVAGTSSGVSGGMIDPVTGRRIVKTWMADTLIPFARKTILTSKTNSPNVFSKTYRTEIYNDNQHRNDWAGRSADEGMDLYVKDECPRNAVPARSPPLADAG